MPKGIPKIKNHRLDVVAYEGFLRLYCIRCDTLEIPSADGYILDAECVPDMDFQEGRRKELRKRNSQTYRDRIKLLNMQRKLEDLGLIEVIPSS